MRLRARQHVPPWLAIAAARLASCGWTRATGKVANTGWPIPLLTDRDRLSTASLSGHGKDRSMHPVRLYVRQVEPCAREAAGESSRSGRPPSQGDQHLTEWQGFLDVLAGGAPSPRPRREVGGPAGHDSVAASPGTMRQSPTAPHPDGSALPSAVRACWSRCSRLPLSASRSFPRGRGNNLRCVTALSRRATPSSLNSRPA
jgi:hypothetical protein